MKNIIVSLQSVSLRAIRPNDMEVKLNTEVKYLGIMLGEKLLRKTLVKYISRKLTRTLMWSIAGKNWGPGNTMLDAFCNFKAITYVAVVWVDRFKPS